MKKANIKYILLGLGISILFIVLLVFVLIPYSGMVHDMFANTGVVPYSVNVATTSNISLSGLQLVDNFGLTNGMRILVKDQSDPIANGIYVASGGNWVRASDFQEGRGVTLAEVVVSNGRVNGNSKWLSPNVDEVVVGRSPLVFVRIYTKEYEQRGNGIMVDEQKLSSKISGLDINNPYFNVNGYNYDKIENGVPVQLAIKRSDYRNLQGYMAPSFAFYPYTIYSKEYTSTKNDTGDATKINWFRNTFGTETPSRIELGSQTCKDMCSKTGCIGVETEVTENCIFDNTCGNQSEASCTLYYPSVGDADNAYYNISLANKDLVGRKYYEMNISPEVSPDTRYSPKDSPVKWCDANNAETVNLSNKYETKLNSKAACTCTNSTQNCDDTNCCKVRNLVTTGGVKISAPFYNLPINKVTGRVIEAIQYKYDSVLGLFDFKVPGSGTCCGSCVVNGKRVLVSCRGGEKGKGWVPKAGSGTCTDQSKIVAYSDATSADQKKATEEYKAAISNNTLDQFSENNCIGIFDSADLRMVQPSCVDADWKQVSFRHGCVGGPPILVADSVDVQNTKSCTNVNSSLKCEQTNSMCKEKFAISCNQDSPELFIPKSN